MHVIYSLQWSVESYCMNVMGIYFLELTALGVMSMQSKHLQIRQNKIVQAATVFLVSN